LEEALGERIGLTDEEWRLIGPLLPAERGRGCRPAQDNRRYFEGMMWLARTGAQWRHLLDDYGRWNHVFRRYCRWLEVGIFNAMLESLAELVKRDPSADMIDSTTVRAHHCAAGIKEGAQQTEALGKSRGGFTTKLHARCDARGRPLGFVLTGGEAHDIKGFAPLLRMIADRIEALLADKGYDADTIRNELAKADIEAVILAKRNRR
jgi:transposase